MDTLNLLDATHQADSVALEPVATYRARWPWVVLAVLVASCLLLAPFVYAVVTAGTHALVAKRALETVYNNMSTRSFAQAQTSLMTAKAELRTAKIAWRQVGPWRTVPWVSTQIIAVDNLFEAGSVGLEAAEQVVQAAIKIQTAFEAVLHAPELAVAVAPERTFSDLSPAEKRTILASIDQALPLIRAAREQTLIALEAWDRIPQARLLPPVRQALAPITEVLAKFRDRSQTAVDLAGLVLPMLGYPQAKTYIVLLQNADEMRATGGFIGTVGTVRLDAGEVISQAFQDVYAFDRMASSTLLGAPPAPLKRELGVDVWYLRDSNWSPDAPQTAERISQLFQKHSWLVTDASSTQAAIPDGVIFLEPDFFAVLLRFTGPITVDGTTFTADAFFDQLQYAVEVGFVKQGIPVEERKQIMSKIANAILARVVEQPRERWLELFDLGLEAFARKDVMLVMRDAELGRAFDVRGWSGRARATTQDELWVVDTNLAALKTDGVMEKRVDYQLDATNPAGLTATVRLTYTNTNRTINWRYTRYRDYVRVFVPEGSQLIASEGAMEKDLNQSGGKVRLGQVDVMKDLGKTVFGVFWSIEPGETRSLSFTYHLPARVSAPLLKEGKYTLLLQKQPGAKQRLTVNLRLGKKLIAATPKEAVADYGDDRYHATFALSKDTLIETQVEH